MNKLRKIAACIVLFAAFMATGSSKPAIRGRFMMSQPDGTTFFAKLSGDEFLHILTTEDGCALAKGEDGCYEYAFYKADGSIRTSGYRPGDAVPQAILAESRNIPYQVLNLQAARQRLQRRGVMPERRTTRPDSSSEGGSKTRSETKANRHCIVLLVQFPDLKFNNEEGRRDEFNDMINSRGYSRDGAAGSVLDYFEDQLGHVYDFQFDVAEIVTVSKSYKYYGEDDGSTGFDAHPDELAAEACILADDAVDFSRYDDDGDGVVDNIFIYVAGMDQAEGADSDYIWPHQWYVNRDIVLDGKKIGPYAMATELEVEGYKSNGQPIWGFAKIGAFCHEFSHVLGLMDLYDTDGEESGGLSDCLWFCTAIMDGGSYNNNGKTPPGYNAIDYELLGAGNPEKLSKGRHTLSPVDVSRRYFIHENPENEYEFFLFECRYASGWDKWIGGRGLAIYHIDMSNLQAGFSESSGKVITALQRWMLNEVNCNPEHQCADMMESEEGAVEVRQAFFPFGSRNSFNWKTKPGFIFNDGTVARFAISNIQREGESVSFTVSDINDVMPNVTDLSFETYQDAAIITWNSDMPEAGNIAEVTWGPTSKLDRTVTVEPYEAGKYSLTLEGLSPTTSYSFQIMFKDGQITGETVSGDILTKAKQSKKKPYIYLDYLEPYRIAGKFKAGTGLPLRVFNAIGAKVDWYYDGQPVKVDESGYFHPKKSGVLKAKVSTGNGDNEILAKEINLY